ncbi:hypothetical protein LB503_007802 [Fusarium chuoi]|nr:hypothetical protein LB503_007802 [Fusarium chuoi]
MSALQSQNEPAVTPVPAASHMRYAFNGKGCLRMQDFNEKVPADGSGVRTSSRLHLTPDLGRLDTYPSTTNRNGKSAA